MNSFVVAAIAIVPITVIMALGFLSRKAGWVRETSFKDMTWVVFHFCLPVSLFRNILGADMSDLGSPKLFIYVIACLVIIVALGALGFSRSSMDNKRKGVLVHDLYRTNFVILGLPVVESVCGAENTGVASIMIATIVPIFNISAVLVMQKYAGGKANLTSTIKALLKNPMILAIIIALAFRLVGINHVPVLVDECLALVNKMSTPLALFALGGSIQENSLRDNMKMLVFFSVLKLVLIPVIVLGGAIMMGYDGPTLVTLLVLFGGPAAVASYPMAESMGLDGEFAAQCVLVSTVLVMFTMFFFISGFGLMGLI